MRRLGRLKRAVLAWATLRRVTDATNYEVVELALSLSHKLSKLARQHPCSALMRHVQGVAVEALCVLNGKDTPEARTTMAEVGRLVELLTIDWVEPRVRETIQARMEALDRLSPCRPHLPAAVGRDIAFWSAMGRWRVSQGLDYADLYHRFDELCLEAPDDGVYRWCRWRVLHEAATGDGAGADLPPSEVPEGLGRYFDALCAAECARHLRPRRPVPDWEQARGVLSEPPDVLRHDKRLRRHVRRVLRLYKGEVSVRW